jgi:hypothetical protein
MPDTLPETMLRPALMVRAARWAARRYRRRRDLPGAIAGLAAGPAERIVPALRRAEAEAEAMRRAGAPGYRPARHLQILAAMIAETGGPGG